MGVFCAIRRTGPGEELQKGRYVPRWEREIDSMNQYGYAQ